MKLTVFYSWQSDRPSALCRNFIHVALRDAAERLAARREVEVVVDSDTQGVPGTPPITAVILEKIEACDVFVADMSFVAETDEAADTGEKKRLPNPNVMGEFGYALSEKGWRRILLVMNEAYGPSKALPFDLGHFRKPATYTLASEKPDAARRSARSALSARLEMSLEAVLDDILGEPAAPAIDVKARLWQLAIETQNARVANRPPVLVSQPSAAIYLAPASALEAPTLDLKGVAAARHLLIPDLQARAIEGQDHTQWWAHGPARAVARGPNPEARWSCRLLRPGVIENLITIGERIDDDPYIGVEGLQLEAMLVAAIDRALELLAAIGLDGPVLVAAALYDVEEVEIYGGRGRGRVRLPTLGLTPTLIPQGETRSGTWLHHAFDEIWLASGRSDGSPSYAASDEWAGYQGSQPYAI